VTGRLLHPDKRLPEMQRVPANAIEHRLQENLLQDAAMQGDLGPPVPGGEAALLPPDLLTAPCAIDELRGRY
jgi:hypothetical protein